MEDFVTYELAVKLKEKGYPQHICDYAYITEDDYEENKYVVGDREYIPFIPDYLPTIAAPIISQVLKWLREEKKLHIIIPASFDEGYWWEIRNFNKEISEYSDEEYKTYEEAALVGIEYVLDNLI